MFPAADLWLFLAALTPFINLMIMKKTIPLASLCKLQKLADCYADSVSNNSDTKRNTASYSEIVASDACQSALIKTLRVQGLFPTSLNRKHQRCAAAFLWAATSNHNCFGGNIVRA